MFEEDVKNVPTEELTDTQRLGKIFNKYCGTYNTEYADEIMTLLLDEEVAKHKPNTPASITMVELIRVAVWLCSADVAKKYSDIAWDYSEKYLDAFK